MAIVAAKKNAVAQADLFEADVSGWDSEGRGIVRRDGKAVFVTDALPGERVLCRVTRTGKRFDEAEAVCVLRPSESRRTPPCPHYAECGGCSMQHVEFAAQVAMKQRAVEEQCERIGRVRPTQMLAPVYGLPWHYRERGHFGVQADEGGRLKIGFRAKRSNRLADISSCMVLPRHLSAVLPLLKEALQTFAGILRGIEFAVGGGKTALCLLTDKRPSEKQRGALRALSETLGSGWLLSWKAGDREEPLYGGQGGLSYRLDDFAVEMPFDVGSFTQVNERLNNVMVRRAVEMLSPQRGERVVDLFCGLGNFTLPLARSGAHVTGVEGLPALTDRARRNAVLNGCGNASFETADLFCADGLSRFWRGADKMLLDPPRAGAYEVVKSLRPSEMPARVVYVSCNPASFARDAAVLVEKGYKFKSLGVMNLFSQTAHVESVGCFER